MMEKERKFREDREEEEKLAKEREQLARQYEEEARKRLEKEVLLYSAMLEINSRLKSITLLLEKLPATTYW